MTRGFGVMRGIATLKLGDFETSHTLGGAAYTSRDIDLAVVARGWAGLKKPMDLGVCVSGESGYGEGAGSQTLLPGKNREEKVRSLSLYLQLNKTRSECQGPSIVTLKRVPGSCILRVVTSRMNPWAG